MAVAINPTSEQIPYWSMLEGLSDDVKLNLISMLSLSLKKKKTKTRSARQFYGILGDCGCTAEEWVNEIREGRCFRNDSILL